MPTPRVTEIPLRLAPVEHDPFVDVPSRASVVARRPRAREERERRMEVVRGLMRARAAGIRNGWPAGPTERA
jgi:hypothetical protein